MLKNSLYKRLRSIGVEPVPEGHRKHNKGVTTFFFAPGKQQQVEQLLQEQGLASAGVVEIYHHKPTNWVAHNNGFLTHSACLAQYKGLLFVEIVRWPA